MGDLLFALANLARKLGIEPEAALRRANDKFQGRFDSMERGVTAARASSCRTLTLDRLEERVADTSKAPSKAADMRHRRPRRARRARRTTQVVSQGSLAECWPLITAALKLISRPNRKFAARK